MSQLSNAVFLAAALATSSQVQAGSVDQKEIARTEPVNLQDLKEGPTSSSQAFLVKKSDEEGRPSLFLVNRLSKDHRNGDVEYSTTETSLDTVTLPIMTPFITRLACLTLGRDGSRMSCSRAFLVQNSSREEDPPTFSLISRHCVRDANGNYDKCQLVKKPVYQLR